MFTTHASYKPAIVIIAGIQSVAMINIRVLWYALYKNVNKVTLQIPNTSSAMPKC